MGDGGKVVTARSGVSLQAVGQEAILHDQRNGMAHVINGSAARVWELCDGRPLADLLAAFAEPYGMSVDAVREDVEGVLAQFEELGLVSVAEAPR